MIGKNLMKLDWWISILRAFLIEEQKIVKKVASVKAQQKKEETKSKLYNMGS